MCVLRRRRPAVLSLSSRAAAASRRWPGAQRAAAAACQPPVFSFGCRIASARLPLRPHTRRAPKQQQMSRLAIMASPVAARMNDDTAPNLHGGSSSSRLALPQLSRESVVGATKSSSLIELVERVGFSRDLISLFRAFRRLVEPFSTSRRRSRRSSSTTRQPAAEAKRQCAISRRWTSNRCTELKYRV